MNRKMKLATVWLDGCSGCHMSFLDMDERLLELAEDFDLVYSPLVDFKTYPPEVDVVLVEGAVSSEEDLTKIQHIRERTKTLVSFGDCAVTGNVPSLRNLFGVEPVVQRVYGDGNSHAPNEGVPRLLERVRPVHEVVQVDIFVPGCPPSADTIYNLLRDLHAGKKPSLGGVTRFGK